MEKTLEEIQRDVRNWYCRKLDTMQIKNEFDLILYCSYAGRLYSLGIKQYMPIADAYLHNNSFLEEVDQIFLDRIDQGIWDLQEQTGKEVGISLTELQDIHSFLKHTSYPFSDQVRQSFADWIEAGRYADVNDETFDYLNDFFDANPLDYSDVLEELVEPITQEVREMEYLLSGIRYTECQPKEVNNGWEFSDAGYDLRLEFKQSSENVLCFEVYERQLDEKVPAEGVSIRQDILPAVQDPDSPLNWSIDYLYFPGLDNSKRKQEQLTIRLPMGGVCKIPVPSSAPISTEKVNTEQKPYLAQRTNVSAPLTLSAADSKHSDKKLMSITGLDDVYLKIWFDKPAKQIIVQARSSQNNRMTDKLDGWSLFGKNGIFLGTFNGKTVRYPYSDENIPVLLKDKNETSYLLTIKEEN